MDVKADVLPPDLAEPWVRRPQEAEAPQRVRPVEEADAAVQGKRKEQDSDRQEAAGGLDTEALREVAERTQAYLDELNIRLDFEVYEETGEMIIRVINRETEELIRQIPPEELLKLHHKIAELRGVLFDEKA